MTADQFLIAFKQGVITWAVMRGSTFAIALILVFLFKLIFTPWRRYILFLTVRYLTKRVMSYLAVALITAAVGALVVAPSVMNGFSFEFRKKVRGTLSDLMVWGPTPFSFPAPSSYEDLREPAEREARQEKLLGEIYSEMRRVPGVAEISPYIDNPALYKHFKRIDYCLIRGVDPVLEAKVSKFSTYILSDRKIFEILEEETLKEAKGEELALYQKAMNGQSEKVDLEKTFRYMKKGVVRRLDNGDVEGPYPGVLVGVYFLKSYNLLVGDIIELTTASDSSEVSEKSKFVIVGAFQSGFYEQDRRKIYMDLSAAQKFIKVEKRVSGISIKCKEGLTADAVRTEIGNFVFDLIEQGKFPSRSPARTWEEKDENLLKAVAMEKLLIRLITSLLVCFAMCSIFVVLVMSVREKARDLGILKALGGTTLNVFRIYLGQGVLITLTGVICGFLLGGAFSIYINEIATVIESVTGWHPFPPDVYYLEKIPVLVDPIESGQNVLFTTCAAIFLAGIPGAWAASLDPIEAVRYE